jgi:uncharacterized membrane protein
VALLILLAAFLRFHRLDFESLWADEIQSAVRAQSPTMTDALLTGPTESAWPAYHIPLFLFERLAGSSEFALRLPSALAGVLLIPMLFVLGRRMFSAREGLIAAGLAVAMNAPLWYSQEMRAYALLMLLAAASGYLWFRLAQDLVWGRTPRRLSLAGYTASIILVAYSHHFGLVLIGVEGLGALLLAMHLRRIPWPLAAAYGACALAYIPWMPLMLGDLSKSVFWIIKPRSAAASGLEYLSFLFDRPLDILALGIAAAGVAMALWRSWRRKGGRSLPLAITPGVVLSGWFVLPFALAYWRSLTAPPVLLDRYLLVSLPAAYVLLARAVTRLPITRPGQGLAGAALLVFALVNTATGTFYTVPDKPQLRQAIQYIASHEQQYPGAMIVGGAQALGYYYPRYGKVSVDELDIAPLGVKQARQAIADRQPRYIWFIGQRFLYDRSFPDSLTQDFDQRDEQEFFNVSLLLYERKPAGGQTP